jgi:transcription elongation factor GreA
MQVPRRRSEQFIKRDTGPFTVTAAGLQRLKDQLARLEKELPEMIAEVERTKGHGDFSENAAYQDAKHTMRRTHSRVASIKDRIKRAVIIEQGANDSGTVQLGSTVVLEAGGRQVTFEILGPHEADPSRGRISDQSPLGQALLNHVVGDQVTLTVQAGEVVYRILEIK